MWCICCKDKKINQNNDEYSNTCAPTVCALAQLLWNEVYHFNKLLKKNGIVEYKNSDDINERLREKLKDPVAWKNFTTKVCCSAEQIYKLLGEVLENQIEYFSWVSSKWVVDIIGLTKDKYTPIPERIDILMRVYNGETYYPSKDFAIEPTEIRKLLAFSDFLWKYYEILAEESL